MLLRAALFTISLVGGIWLIRMVIPHLWLSLALSWTILLIFLQHFQSRSPHIRRFVFWLTAAVATGVLCFVILSLYLFGPPNTFRDMTLKVDLLPFPEKYELIGGGQNGSRGGFMGLPTPYVEHHYAAPWDDGRLCDDLYNFSAELGEVSKLDDAHCGYRTTIDAGWRARLVNVHQYHLVFMVMSPEHVQARPLDQCCTECAREASTRATREAEIRAMIREGVPGFPERAHCRILPGEALVNVKLYGKAGW